MEGSHVANGRTRAHEAVRLTSPGGTPALIDTTIAPLIQHLWDLGVTTLASCEAYSDGRARILFGCAGDLEQAHVALHDLATAEVRASALMHARAESDWAVAAWAKLWFTTPPEPSQRLDGPTTLYYELSMPAAHAANLARAVSSTSRRCGT